MRDVVKSRVTPVEDLTEIPEPYFKISIYEKGGLQDTAFWAERFGDRSTVVTGGAAWLDIMPKGVTKLTAFTKLLDCLGVLPEECLVLGDNDNDREMLLAAGIPGTVTSAKKEIHDIARISGDTVESILELLLAGRLPV